MQKINRTRLEKTYARAIEETDRMFPRFAKGEDAPDDLIRDYALMSLVQMEVKVVKYAVRSRDKKGHVSNEIDNTLALALQKVVGLYRGIPSDENARNIIEMIEILCDLPVPERLLNPEGALEEPHKGYNAAVDHFEDLLEFVEEILDSDEPSLLAA